MKYFKPIPDNDRKYHPKVLKGLKQEMENSKGDKKFELWFKIQMWLFACNTRFIWDSSYDYFIFRKEKRFKAAFYTAFPSFMPKVWLTRADSPNVYIYSPEEHCFVGFDMVRLSIGYVVNNMDPRSENYDN
jgi:hypothetical protein